MQQALNHGSLTCCWVSCSIAGGGGLDGACGLRCSLAPGLRTPCLALGRGSSATASGRGGLGRLGFLWALGALHLLSAASCRGSHLQEQASSRVSHRRSESCCAIWNRQAGGLQQSTGSAAATCRTKKHSAGRIWCRCYCCSHSQDQAGTPIPCCRRSRNASEVGQPCFSGRCTTPCALLCRSHEQSHQELNDFAHCPSQSAVQQALSSAPGIMGC